MPKREQPTPKTVELVRSSYRPTKAEINQEFEVDLPEDASPNHVDAVMEGLGKAMTQPVSFRRIDKPRSRRKYGGLGTLVCNSQIN